MSELYDRADNMFGELVIPESFSEALSYAEQLIWLYLHKQNELIEGENITLTDNGDGTVTISASMDGVKGIDRIESTVETDKTVVVIYYTDGTFQSFNVLAGPQGPQGIQGIPGQDGAPGVQGDPGLGIKSIEVTNIETATVEIKGTRINPDESSVSQSFQKQIPKRSVLTITYDDDTTDTVYAYAGASTYVGETIRDLSVTPNTHTIKFKMYNPADGMISSLQDITITDGAQGPQGVPGQDGQDGAPGATGATPNITMTASVLPTAGIPDVQISKTGTDENPVFDLMFSGLKGENGQNGQDGVGVPTGGTKGQVLIKNSGTDYDTKWQIPGVTGVVYAYVSAFSADSWTVPSNVHVSTLNCTLGMYLLLGHINNSVSANNYVGWIKQLSFYINGLVVDSDISAGSSLGSISMNSYSYNDLVMGYGELTQFSTTAKNIATISGMLTLTDGSSYTYVPVMLSVKVKYENGDFIAQLDVTLYGNLPAGNYTIVVIT